MSVEREKIFALIKERLPQNVSFIEEVADVLDISYDAMYRRINGKTLLSFDEAIKLAKHYRISINSIYSFEQGDNVIVLKKKNSNTITGVTTFFQEVVKSIKTFNLEEDSELFYAAKDIPIYYLPEESLYTKFKLYVVSQGFLSEKERIRFKDFNVPVSLLQSAKDFTKIYQNIRITEIWNDTTINSALYQIYYFYETKLISKEEANLLCLELEKIVQQIEKKSTDDTLSELGNKKYDLYYNKSITLNNTSFFKRDKIKILIIPYTHLSYIRIDDKDSCEEYEQYFKQQVLMSKKISGKSEVVRELFFTSVYEKINQLKQQIEVKSLISFM